MQVLNQPILQQTAQFSATIFRPKFGDESPSGIILAKPGEETLSETQATTKQVINAFMARVKIFLENTPEDDKQFFSTMADIAPTLRHVNQLEAKLKKQQLAGNQLDLQG